MALPDPTAVMTPSFRASLDELLAAAPAGVAELVDEQEQRFYNEFRTDRPSEALETPHVGVPPPVVLTPVVRTLEGLKLSIEAVDERWRLDALAALDDYVS